MYLRTQVYRTSSRRDGVDTQNKPDLERSLSRQFAVLADDARVARTATALEANGISVVRAADAEEAKRIVLVWFRPEPRSTTVPRSRSRKRALPRRSTTLVGTSPSTHGSGAWT